MKPKRAKPSTRPAAPGYSRAGLRRIVLDMRQMKNFCAQPIVISRGEGIYCYDTAGKRYIEGVSGIYVTNIGHGNRHVIEAIRRQQEKISFVAPLHAVAETAIRYSERLAQLAPAGIRTVKLLSGGSEATESAIKFARQYHGNTGHAGKYKVISNYSGYHGGTMGAISASGLGWPRKTPFAPFLPGFIQIPPPNFFRPPYGQDSKTYARICGQILDYTIRAEGPDTVSAFIVEPVSNTGGIIVPPPEYLREIRAACSEHNVLLIFDEVVTGMGRTGQWFAAQTFGVTPDILCAGKGLGSGYSALSAMLVRDEIYDRGFWADQSENPGFSHSHTYGANPIAAAAGLAVIEVIEREGLLARGREVGDHIRRRLRTEVGRLGILGEVRGVGALSCVEFVQEMKAKTPFPDDYRFGKRVEARLLAQGLLLRCDPHWIAIAPPLIMTRTQADEMVDLFLSCVQAELKAGSPPAKSLRRR